MLAKQYSGVILEDKWGNTYLCSKSLLAYVDFGQDYLWKVQDRIYGVYFLHDLEPYWDLRRIWSEMYQHARPWEHNLAKYTDFQLRDSLIEMFAEHKMWVWQLTEGWAIPPPDDGIGDGGLAPATSDNTSAAPAVKANKPGGNVATEQPAADKIAVHNTKSQLAVVAKPLQLNKVEPESLEHAQQILAERRKQIEQSGYQPKYSDAELLAMAKAGEITNERFHVRFMAASNLKYNSLGAAMEGSTGKGAKYWSTTFDQMEAADSDPELICKMIGIEYDPNTDYALAIIDTEKAYQMADTKCVVASFERLNQFCKEELSSKFTDEEIDLLLSDEYQNYYAQQYEEANESGLMQSPNDIKGAQKYFSLKNMTDEERILINKRLDMHQTLGNNQHYLGNGLTKNLLANKQQYGVVETLNFERKMIGISDYGDAVIVNPKLTTIKG